MPVCTGFELAAQVTAMQKQKADEGVEMDHGLTIMALTGHDYSGVQ